MVRLGGEKFSICSLPSGNLCFAISFNNAHNMTWRKWPSSGIISPPLGGLLNAEAFFADFSAVASLKGPFLENILLQRCLRKFPHIRAVERALSQRNFLLLEHSLQPTPSPDCGLASWPLLGACSMYPGEQFLTWAVERPTPDPPCARC
jgi:hypothetical protein